MDAKTKEALGILQEEAAEVIQAASKAMRFGLDNWYKDGGTQQENLTQEIGDLLALVDILIDQGVVSAHDLDNAKLRKVEKLKVWSNLFN